MRRTRRAWSISDLALEAGEILRRVDHPAILVDTRPAREQDGVRYAMGYAAGDWLRRVVASDWLFCCRPWQQPFKRQGRSSGHSNSIAIAIFAVGLSGGV